MATTRAEKPEVRKVLSGRAIVNIQKLVGSVAVSEYVVKYVARLVRSTRPKDSQAPPYVAELVDWGAGPRAGQFLIQGGKAMAAMDGRFSVSIDDVRRIAVPVLRHRIATNFQAQADGLTSESIVEHELALVKVRASVRTRAEVVSIAEMHRGRVVDLTDDSAIIEVVGEPAEVDRMVELLRGFGIKELVRTGSVVMARGSGSIEEQVKR